MQCMLGNVVSRLLFLEEQSLQRVQEQPESLMTKTLHPAVKNKQEELTRRNISVNMPFSVDTFSLNMFVRDSCSDEQTDPH